MSTCYKVFCFIIEMLGAFTILYEREGELLYCWSEAPAILYLTVLKENLF